MSDIEQIRCVHENGKVCFLTKKDTENRNFMKKYGIRVEHVERKDPSKQPVQNTTTETNEIRQAIDAAVKAAQEIPEIKTTNPEAEAQAIDKQVADALAEAEPKPTKPKATRTRAAKSKKPTKK